MNYRDLIAMDINTLIDYINEEEYLKPNEILEIVDIYTLDLKIASMLFFYYNKNKDLIIDRLIKNKNNEKSKQLISILEKVN